MRTILLGMLSKLRLCVLFLGVDNCLAVGPESPGVQISELLEKYDANRNGKIDVEERKGYVQDIARQRREEARRLVQAQGEGRVAPPRIAPVRITRELFLRYDTNGNGKLDPEERTRLEADAQKAKEEELKRIDRNGDGQIDRREREAWANGVRRSQ